MDLKKRVSDIMFRFGATGRNPEMIDSVQFLLYKQMSMLLFQSYMNAKHCGKNEVSVLNIVFVLKKYPYTLIKLLQYFNKKSLEEKVVQPCKTDNDDINSGARLIIKKRKKSAVVPKINLADFFIDNSNDRLNIESTQSDTLHKSEHFSATDQLEDNSDDKIAETYEKTNTHYRRKKNTVINVLIEALKKLDISLKHGHYEIVNAHNYHAVKMNSMILHSPSVTVEEYQLCRSLSFHDTDLMKDILYVYELHIKYDKYAEEVLLFLALETISCLFFRIYQNKYKKNNLSDCNKFTHLMRVTNLKDYPVTLRDIEEIVADLATTNWSHIKFGGGVPYTQSSIEFYGKLLFD